MADDTNTAERAGAYDMIDRFLRNNLSSDEDYAEYSKALDLVLGASLAASAGSEPVAPAAPPMDGEIALIEKAVKRVGIKSLLNYGAGSLVYSEGVEGVTQDDLLAYTREIALHCAVALGSPQEGMAGWTKASEQLPPCRDNQLYIGVNSAGFAGVFNAVTSIAGNVYCHYETAEESIDVLGDLAIWKQFNPPLPASEAKEL